MKVHVHMSPQANRDETTMTATRGPAAPPRGAARGRARAPRAAGATTQRAAGARAHRVPRQTRAVGDSLTIPLDAEPRAVVAALDRVDLAAPVARALEALDLAGRVVLSPAVLGPAGGGGLALGLIWRIGPTAPEQRVEPHAFEAFGSRGHVKVRWEVQVRAAADGGSFLSIATRFTATDDDSRARLLDAWGLVGPISRNLARRAARTVQARAEAAQQNEMAA
jgi:hypothetical protein